MAMVLFEFPTKIASSDFYISLKLFKRNDTYNTFYERSVCNLRTILSVNSRISLSSKILTDNLKNGYHKVNNVNRTLVRW